MQSLTLFELNSLVRGVLELQLGGAHWLRAELSEVRESRGHCYVEFVQKEENGNAIVARARGQAWAGRWSLIRPYFERTTGQRLAAGMQVLVEVRVTFHEAYGYSLNITDIDPAYTLGDIARRRQEIIRQLEAEGVLTMNKELPLPRLLRRIAVVSSATAAGYQDFRSQLDGNPHGLAFRTRLFPATMQGADVEASVVGALDAIAAQAGRWDAVAIIRGGGASSDLSGFDTLRLAEHVAQFPLPVITGIGHERDDTVIDLVAHTRVKTPTAAAEFLIRHQKAELDRVEGLAASIAAQATGALHRERERLLHATAALPALLALRCQREEARLKRLLLGLRSESLRAPMQGLSLAAQTEQRLRSAARALLERERHRLELRAGGVRGASPDRLLRLGFSITRVNGRAVTSAAQVKPGDTLTTTLTDGAVRSTATD